MNEPAATAVKTSEPAAVPADTQISPAAYAATAAKVRNAEANIAAVIAQITAAMTAKGKTPEQIKEAVNKVYDATDINVGEANESFVSRVAQSVTATLTAPTPAAGAKPEGEAASGNFLTNFFKNGGVGNLLGSIGGVGIGAFLGNFIGGLFGGGFMGTFLTIALGAVGLMVGGNKLGPLINQTFGVGGASADGKGSDPKAAGRGQQRTAQVEQPETLGRVTQQQFAALVAEVGSNPKIALLKWGQNEAELRSVAPGQSDQKSIIDIAPLIDSKCAGDFIIKTKDGGVQTSGGQQVEVMCSVPKRLAGTQGQTSRQPG